MYITKLSSKGQIVLPQSMRKELPVGTAFSIIQKDDLIVLKPIPELTAEEQADIKMLERIWKEIDSGKFTRMPAEDFLRELDSW